MKQNANSKDITFSKYRFCLKQPLLEAHKRNIYNWSIANAVFPSCQWWRGDAEIPCTGDISTRTEPSTPGDPSGCGGSSLHCICLRGCPGSSCLVGQWTNSLDQLLLNPNSGDRADPWDPTNMDIRTWRVTGSNVSPASLLQHSQCPLLAVKNAPFLHQHCTTWNYTPCLGHPTTSRGPAQWLHV